MRWFSFFPRHRHNEFYDLLEQGAENLVTGSEQLVDLLQHFENVEMKTRHMKELEHIGDGITHQIIALLHRTFVTPIDREDLVLLAQRMDDVMDLMEGASTAIRIYGIQDPTSHARSLADIIRLQTLEVRRSIASLRNRSQFRRILEHGVEINRLENEADSLFLDALAELFDHEASMAEVIKWREIYAQLEEATDRCEDIANVLEGVVLKYG